MESTASSPTTKPVDQVNASMLRCTENSVWHPGISPQQPNMQLPSSLLYAVAAFDVLKLLRLFSPRTNRNPCLPFLLSPCRIVMKICGGEPDAQAGTWSKVAYVFLVVWHLGFQRTSPNEKHKTKAPPNASNCVNVPLTSAERHSASRLQPVFLTGILLPPFIVKFQVASSILRWVCQSHCGTVVAIRRLRVAPEHLRASARRCQLILLFNLSPPPPDRVELHIVSMWWMA
mmetsp:Transcript_25465/g.49911  ORF Transcript_25465/g.49911 Transcript_25465/m.49911 type:complete len:231 (-) Transcript_25465:1669-2361(-)